MFQALYFLFIISLWAGCAILAAKIGKRKVLGFYGTLFISLVTGPIGIIIALLLPLSRVSILDEKLEFLKNKRYEVSFDEAKKAEFKGETEKAISLYKDTLYYLDNDYKNLNNKAEKNRQATIADVKGRIEKLMCKLQDIN